MIPLWFNDLIEHGFEGLLSIVTKNLSEEGAEEDASGGQHVRQRRSASLAGEAEADQFLQYDGQQLQSHLIGKPYSLT